MGKVVFSPDLSSGVHAPRDNDDDCFLSGNDHQSLDRKGHPSPCHPGSDHLADWLFFRGDR